MICACVNLRMCLCVCMYVCIHMCDLQYMVMYLYESWRLGMQRTSMVPWFPVWSACSLLKFGF